MPRTKTAAEKKAASLSTVSYGGAAPDVSVVQWCAVHSSVATLKAEEALRDALCAVAAAGIEARESGDDRRAALQQSAVKLRELLEALREVNHVLAVQTAPAPVRATLTKSRTK